MNNQNNMALQNNYWPPVSVFQELDSKYSEFIYLPIDKKVEYMQSISNYSHDEVGEFIQHVFSIVFSYYYGYRDSSCYLKTDLELELKLIESNFFLTNYYITNWLNVRNNNSASINDGIDYLKFFIGSNSGVSHKLFDYLEHDATKETLIEFLMLETCRNEVVDDEVALLVQGLQGEMKNAIASNLWDECGNGKLNQCHTFWLRRLLGHLDLWDDIISYREKDRPWFTNITSNTFNMLLTRPAFKLMAYGCFLTTEAWVQPHFKKILNGLNRVGFIHEDISIYFSAHAGIDVRHTKEIFKALEHQIPHLTLVELQNVITGAQIAATAGVESYNRLLLYFKSKHKE